MSDLISRQAAIDMFQNMAYDDWNQGVSTSWADAFSECAEMIRDLPSTQPLDPCETCLHKGKGWDEEPCDGCTGTESKYEPDNGWIPVNERLPEDGQDCLVTYSVTYSSGHVEIATFAEDLYEVDEYNFHDKRGVAGWFYFDDEYGYLEYPDVIAWMPLPEPYRSET